MDLQAIANAGANRERMPLEARDGRDLQQDLTYGERKSSSDSIMERLVSYTMDIHIDQLEHAISSHQLFELL